MPRRLPALLCAVALASPAAFAGQTCRDGFEAQAASVSRDLRDSLRASPMQTRLLGEDRAPEALGIDGKEPLPNFHKIDEGLLRSGQPNREGLARLKAQGVKTLLYLREDAGKDEAAEAARLGLRFERVSMSIFHAPRFHQVDRALAVLKDPAARPVVVHCRHGKDRTGFVVAAYRVVEQGWPVDRAVAEAKSYRCCVWNFGSLGKWLAKYKAHAGRKRSSR